MKTIYDIHNQLQQNSAAGIEYHSGTNSIAYSTPELSVRASENGSRFQIEFTYDGQAFSCIAPDCGNVYSLFAGLADQKISINRLSDIHVVIKGYDNKKTRSFSKPKAVILSAVGVLMGLFSLLMCLAVPIGSLLFDETFDWGLMPVNLVYIATLLIAVSLVKYAVLQNKYKRRIWMVIIGYAMTGFWSCTAALAMIEDYDKVCGYGADTIGSLVVMLIFALLGVLMLSLSKRKQEEKALMLVRIPTLPDTADADAIFRYMDEACSQGKLPFENISSADREADCELDLFMRYSADQLSIPIDETLIFDELLTVLSKSITDAFDASNVAKYYYYGECE